MPAVYLAPDPINSCQLIPGGVIPASGGKLFHYLAGSSTKTDVYTDITGLVKWANPIILDSGGNLGGSNEVWIPAGVTVKFVLAPFNDTDPPIAPYKTWDNLSGINDPTSLLTEWVVGPTPTFVSTTSFTLVGDQTAIFTPGRRVKTTNTAGTRYGTISTSVFGAVTTVTITNDSGTLDAGLSAVWYGILSVNHDSIPNVVSVMRFGAVGDGVTDDTAAITAAIAGAPLGSYILVPGPCKITSELVLNRAVTLWGMGIGSITQAAAGVQNVVHITASNAGVRDLKLIGNGVTGATASANVVYQDGGDDVLIQNCQIQNGSLTGIQLAGTINRTRMLQNTITATNANDGQSNSSDIYLNSGVISDCEVAGNYCLSTKKNAGILMQPGNAGATDTHNRINVHDNWVQTAKFNGGGCLGIAIYIAVNGAHSRECVIENNQIKDVTGIGIYVKGIITTSDLVVGCRVSGNKLLNVETVGTGGALIDSAIGIEDALGTIVEGNQIRSGGVAGAAAIFVGEQSDETIVINNIIREWTRDGIRLYAGSGTYPNRCVVNANTIASTVGQGMRLNGADHVIANNIVNGSANDGIRAEASAVDMLIIGNRVNGSSNAGISVIAGATRTQIFNNVLRNNTTPLADAGTATERTGNRLTTGAMSGRAVMVNGTVTVNTAEIQTADNVLLTRVVGTATTRGILTVGTIVAGTSFVIRAEDLAGALSADDDSTVFWEIVH